MRFNQTTLLNIALIVIFGLALTQAEAYMGDYQIYILKLIFINAILALSLNLIYGFTGLFSLGHAGFMAIGAYTAALISLACERAGVFESQKGAAFILVLFGCILAAGLLAALVGLLLGKALFGKKAAPAPAPAPVAAVPAAPQEDEDEIAAVIAAIAAMMGCAPEQVRILSLREDSPWRPTLLISDGGQIDEKIPDKNKWKNI